MKKLLLSAAIVSLATGAYAGGMAAPTMVPDEVAVQTASSSGGVLIPLLLLLLVAAAIASGSKSTPAPIVTGGLG
jgi:hypothetical protein